MVGFDQLEVIRLADFVQLVWAKEAVQFLVKAQALAVVQSAQMQILFSF